MNVTTQVSSILGNVLAEARECRNFPEELYAPKRKLLQRLLEMADKSLNTEVLPAKISLYFLCWVYLCQY